MTVGETPFAAEETFTIYERIAKYARGSPDALSFPWLFPSGTKDLIRRLLHPLPERRPSATDVKEHPLLAAVNFAELEAGTLRPPHAKPLASGGVLANFD